MDAFDILAVVKELKEFEEGYIEKVYNNGDEVFLKIRKGKEKHDIFIKNGKWICITQYREQHLQPSDFAMLLRKHIGRGKIISISQYDFDRIVIFEILKGEIFKLIVELIPNGNIILVDENGTIKGALYHQKWRHRTIKTGEKYSFPPSRKNPMDMDYNEFADIFIEKDVIRSMAKVGIPGKWAEEICAMASIDKKTPVERLSEEHIKKIYDAMQVLFRRFKNGEFKPVIVEEDVLPFPITKYENKKMERYENVNRAFDEFYFRFLKERKKANEDKERIERQLRMQEEAIKKFIQESEKLKMEGDAIFANIDKVERMLKEKSYIEKKYPKAIIEIKYDKNEIPIEIDVRKGAIQNAQEKYEKSKKMKEKARKAKIAMEEAKKSMERKEEKVVSKKITKKFWFENFRWFISSHGNIVLGGKDRKSNERLVKKYMDDDDIYVHADIHGAPSCIIKAMDVEGNKLEIDEETITEACQFALVYSKAWKQYGTASAFWVYPQQVSKSPPAGEFLPPGSFMIRGKRNYVKCRMEFAIGIVEIRGVERIMGGPPSAVKKIAKKWIVFEQGEKDKNSVANEISKIFGFPVEWILPVLPSGGFEKKEEKL